MRERQILTEFDDDWSVVSSNSIYGVPNWERQINTRLHHFNDWQEFNLAYPLMTPPTRQGQGGR